MTLMEMKKKIEDLLAEKFEQIKVNGECCFKKSDGTIFVITALSSSDAFVIEYADDLIQAKQNEYEDGDWFYVKEHDEAELFSLMLREIGW